MEKTLDNKVEDYLSKIADEKRRADCRAMIALIERETGFAPEMWGTAIVGFGSYHYRYDSGREGDAPLAGISSRSNAIACYFADYDGRNDALARLGKHKNAKGCVYVARMSDVNEDVLGEIVRASVASRRAAHGA